MAKKINPSTRPKTTPQQRPGQRGSQPNKGRTTTKPPITPKK